LVIEDKRKLQRFKKWASRMEMYYYIEQMYSYIEARDWLGLESNFERIAESLAGKECASKISEVNLSSYQKSLCAQLSFAVDKAQNSDAKAIYFEYDLDNDWQSYFFICQDYKRQAIGDDEWACDWVDELKGIDLNSFGDLYVSGFDSTEAAKGANLYLIARTVATFGHCCENFKDNSFAICIAFHDQDPVMRIFEPVA
jgi:hypothetical protein